MKVKFTKKYLIWVLLYGGILILASQVVATYLYKDLNKLVSDFINAEIKSEKIIRIDELPYTPGKGTYKEIILTSNKNFPLFIENQDEKIDSIKVNQRITKKPKSKEFEIESNNRISIYEIHTLKSQENFMRVYLLCIAIFTFIIGLLKYNIKISQSK